MPLNWNEIKSRAITFSKEWENESSEDAEAKSFWDDFFNVFGISRRRVASFEKSVKKQDGKQGFIDLLWKGVILVEHKSRGLSLDKAFRQAKDYFPGLKDHELPKFILVSDFQLFRLYDLDNDISSEFALKDFIQNVHLFGFIAGYEKRTYKEQDPANIQAAERMGKLHDALKASGYMGHALEVYLVRLLFCLFAEDTSIFERTQFQDYIDRSTKEDGSDLAMHLAQLFQVMDTPKEKRLKTLDETLDAFPYVNGKLFEEMLPFAAFDSKMREMLLFACSLDWSKISPAIFGSMFQAVMNPKERRNLGAHYTSEKNIQKVIKPLFLDSLYAEFERAKGNKNRLNELHLKIANLHFLDPACGCGNFLIISYRELRQLEIEILRELNKGGQGFLDVREIIRVDVDQFAGIEYDEFPARIAEVAMWLIDHQMNMQISNEFGQYFVRLPLKKAAKIVHGDALETDWEDIVSKNDLSYIIGNPPFIGSKIMTQFQRGQIVKQFDGVDGSGVLDYVTGWYIKAAKYIKPSRYVEEGESHTKIKVAFVSTNSIVQGEQTSILWGQMLNKYNIKIHFAHRTFKWSNEARGNAAVYCVIIGFANYDTHNKSIFEYENIKGEAHELKAKNINPYLLDAKDIVVTSRSKPLFKVPQIAKGNQPTDGGNLILTENEKDEFIAKNQELSLYIKRLVGAEEFLYNKKRYCLWLVNAPPHTLRNSKELIHRLELVKKMRENSTDPKTRQLANTPWLFRETKNYSSFVIVPSTTSENRKYIPMGFGDDTIIPTNLLLIIPDGTLFHFGILTSIMHMAWVKSVCGRLESRFRYSKDIVYNNYPWPENPTDKQITAIEVAAQKVLDARIQFQVPPSGAKGASLADLYDPLTMPQVLTKAHNELDKAVDLAYRPQSFASEAKRMEFLFELYEKYTIGQNLFAVTKPKGKKQQQLNLH